MKPTRLESRPVQARPPKKPLLPCLRSLESHPRTVSSSSSCLKEVLWQKVFHLTHYCSTVLETHDRNPQGEELSQAIAARTQLIQSTHARTTSAGQQTKNKTMETDDAVLLVSSCPPDPDSQGCCTNHPSAEGGRSRSKQTWPSLRKSSHGIRKCVFRGCEPYFFSFHFYQDKT